MATGSVTRQIGTRFTVSGIQSAITLFRDLATSFKSRMISMRDAAAKAFAPIIAGLKKIAAFSFKALEKSASLAFKGLAVGAVLATLKIKSLAAAAVESSKDIADFLAQVSQDSKRLGVSAQDYSALKYGFAKVGVDPDQVLDILSDIGKEFKAVRRDIDQANDAYAQTKSWNLTKVLTRRTVGSVNDALNSESEAAPSSFAGIADQQNFIRQQIKNIPHVEGGVTDETKIALIEAYKKLDVAKLQLKHSMSPQGQGLFTLQDEYGLDFDRAVKGGVDGLQALSEAFVQVQDPQEKLRISTQLFGDEAGVKMISVLNAGSAGIENYRKELERLGGVVTESDAKLGSDYKQNLLNLKMSIQGVRLELARAVLPLLMQSQTQLTEWLVKNKTWIAGTMQAAFVETRNLANDIIGIFHGQRAGFANSWFAAAAPAILWISDLIGKVQTQLSKIFSGRDSDWKWLNLARDGLVYVYDLIKDIWTVAFGGKATTFPWVDVLVAKVKWVYDQVLDLPDQLKKLWNGKDSDWGWLNSIRDGLLYVKDLAVDVWNVLTGGDAQRFDFLNEWRKNIVEFAGHVKDAFVIVKDAFELLHKGVDWLLSWVGGSATTVALVGIFTRIALSITGIGKVAMLAGSAIGSLLGLGGAAAAGGTAVAGAVGAVSTAGAAVAGGGTIAVLTRIGGIATALISRFGLLGLAIGAVVLGGKYALDQSEKSGDTVIQKQLELMRFQADRQVQARDDWKIMHPAPVAPVTDYYGGQAILTRDQLSDLATEQGTSNESYADRRAAIVNSYDENKQAVTERIAVDFNLGGQSFQAKVDQANADLIRNINNNLRTY